MKVDIVSAADRIDSAYLLAEIAFLFLIRRDPPNSASKHQFKVDTKLAQMAARSVSPIAFSPFKVPQ